MENVAFWFRRDLRLEDNTGLYAACQSGKKVLPVFIFDENIISELPPNDARVTFIYRSLEAMDHALRKMGSGLLIKIGDPVKIWEEMIETYHLQAIYANEDYEPYALGRDQQIQKLLEAGGKSWCAFKDQVIFHPTEVLKPSDGSPYTIFTPYKKQWLSRMAAYPVSVVPAIDASNMYQYNPVLPELKEIGFETSEIEVRPYDLSSLDTYSLHRNDPARDATSYLSVHLRFGTVGIRQIVNSLGAADEVFLSELIWREFFMQILYHFPSVVSHNFKSKYDGIAWRNDEADFIKWKEGKTGYPLVDAGMRQLNQTGYMHNRVRMVVASFLCKHLLIDWRWGEAYFAEKLLDYELSSNNGNWQWSAGTGCDAAPYFRIFNPIEQQRKFDPNLQYVKRWVTEYVPPMIDHKAARARALEVYKAGLQKESL